jgi:hypothetical protein
MIGDTGGCSHLINPPTQRLEQLTHMYRHAYLLRAHLCSLSDRRRAIKRGETTIVSHVLYVLIYIASEFAHPLTHHVNPHTVSGSYKLLYPKNPETV